MPKIKLTIVVDTEDENQIKTTKMIGELLNKRHKNQFFKLENLIDMFLGNSVIHLTEDEDTFEVDEIEPLMLYIGSELDQITLDSEEGLTDFISTLTKKDDFIKIVDDLKKRRKWINLKEL